MLLTNENLAAAFAGESQANRKYLAFAAKADAEGYAQAARLFRATAEAETIHAHSHLRAMGGIGSTKENLEAALKGETFEFEKMYPPMVEAAKSEGNKKAERSFSFANEAEKGHAAHFKKVLESLDSLPGADYYVCPVCGHTAEGEPPGKCPICNASGDKYRKID